MTMLEKAARALAARRRAKNPSELDRQRVLAVLEAIRDPDEEMIDAMGDTPGMKAASNTMVLQQVRGCPLDPAAFVDGSPLEQAWRAGIDHITEGRG